MGMLARLILLACVFFGSVSAHAEEFVCVGGTGGLDHPPKEPTIQLKYPAAEAFRESEGWSLFALTIAPDGAVSNVWLRDSIGSQTFAQIALDALPKAKFDPRVRDGGPVLVGDSVAVVFRFDPKDRPGDHNYYREVLDRAAAARAQGDYKESVRILDNSLAWPLHLHEMATMGHAMAVSYMGLKDWRRALRHIRHATIDGGKVAEENVRADALALAAELFARDHDYIRAICTYETLRKQHPTAPVNPTLATAIAETRSVLFSSSPVRTEVEILETNRSDLTPHWSHVLLRKSFAIEQVQGTLKSYRLDCIRRSESGPVVPSQRITLSPGLGCDLYVMGNPGAKFVLDER
jgi:TonB family protein